MAIAGGVESPVTQEWSESDGMASRTEERIGRMLAFVRFATSLFAYVPLFAWGTLARPWLAVGAAGAASVEAVWFAARARRIGTLRDRVLVAGDVVFCLALMLVGTRSAAPHLHNTVATELIPTTLACAAIVGFAFEFGTVQTVAVAALCGGWVLAVVPDVRLKLYSDLLGFVAWYVVASLSMREFRKLSRLADEARAEAEESQRQAARNAVAAEAAWQRERVHREIHDNLLPIVERLLAGEQVEERLLRDARLAAGRARRLISDPRMMERGQEAEDADFAALIHQVCDTSAGGLVLEPVLVVTIPPAADLVEPLCAAIGEALRNAARHAGTRCRVNLYVESTPQRGEIVIRDHGPGFDPGAVAPGGGFMGTFAALERHGARWAVNSAPGRGTTVTIGWEPRAVVGVDVHGTDAQRAEDVSADG
jgi:signal transduction histidine kinase